MSLKTSFCNKSIIKADIKRFWWVSVLYTLGIFLFYTFNYIQNFYAFPDRVHEATLYEYSRIYHYGGGVWVLALIVPVLLACLLFSYMQSGASSTFAHSVPLTRGQTFFSHIISGFVMILFPHIVNTVIFLLYRFDPAFAESYSVSHLLIAMYTGLIYALVAFSGAAFMSFVAGNIISSIVFTYVLGFLPAAVEAFIYEFARIQLFGYSNSYRAVFSEKIYILPDNFTSIKYIVYYLLVSAVFFVLAFLVYKLRNLENHSEVVAFPKIKPLFIYGVAISFGCVGYLYFHGIFGFESALFLIPFGIIGIVVAKMISQKTFRINGVLKSILIYTACIVAVFAVFHFDLTGYEGRVPTIDNVASVEYNLDINTDREKGWDNDGLMYTYDEVYKPIVEDTDTIANIIKLHRVITENKDNLQERRRDVYSYYNMPVSLTYNLKNGKTIQRSYHLNYYDYKDYLNPVAESDVIRQAYFPILRDNDITINHIAISDERINSNKPFVTIYNDDAEFMQQLLDALKKDLLNTKAEEYGARTQTFTSVVVNYTRPAHYENGEAVDTLELSPINDRYYIRPSYETIRSIIEGFAEYDGRYKPEDIEKIGITMYSYSGEYIEVTTGDTIHSFTKVVDNPEKIEKIYNYLEAKGVSHNYSDGYICVILKDGTHYNYDFGLNDKELMELLDL